MTSAQYLLLLATYRAAGDRPSSDWLDQHCLARVAAGLDAALDALDVANQRCRGIEGDVVLLDPRNPTARYARRDIDGSFLGFERRPSLAERHDLRPHPEGGWYRRTWVSDHTVETRRGVRDAASAILYLLPDGQGSRWHVVASDEMWLWHGPGLLELFLEPEQGPRLLGAPAAEAEQKTEQQVVVPAGTWQRAQASGDVLVSCVVCPGFDFADFQLQEE